MYFGLCNSPGMFMHMMQMLFCDMICQCKCTIYMDDLIFKGKTKEELHQNTIEGLKILEKNNLYIKESKWYWEVNEVPVLRHIVGKGRLCMEATKVKTILDWETPKNRKDVQKFNGFCNFYCRYVRGYSKVAHPIMHLMGMCHLNGDPRNKLPLMNSNALLHQKK